MKSDRKTKFILTKLSRTLRSRSGFSNPRVETRCRSWRGSYRNSWRIQNKSEMR